MRDPDTGWINASIYRVQVHRPQPLTIQFDHGGRHGAIIANKYWDQGKSCPVAIVSGEDPALFVAGFEYLRRGRVGIRLRRRHQGRAIEVHPGPVTGLPIPAHAEIIIEGHLKPIAEASLPEGPFGEFTGYFAADKRPCPVMEVDRDPPSQRSDPARLAADEAAALPLRPAVSRRRHLEQSRSRRRHRRCRRLAARLPADDGRRAASSAMTAMPSAPH